MGVKGMIGKGKRDAATRALLQKYRAVYFATFGGAGAYLAKRITESTCIAFEDLGAEAVYRLRVEDFPIIVVNDIYGGDLYEDVLRKRK
jgi:fumarate hydratase subunit beta